MKEKTLSFLILLSALTGFVGLFIGHGDIGFSLEQKHIARYVFVIALGVTFFLIIRKVVSRFFLRGCYGIRLSTLEGIFMLYYFLLTKEARDEWRALIEKKKIEAN